MTNGSGPEAARSPDGRRAASLIAEGEARLAHAGIPAARLEAEVLLARRLGSTRARLILHGGEPVDEAAASDMSWAVNASPSGPGVSAILGS